MGNKITSVILPALLLGFATFCTPATTFADTYTQVNFSGAINGGNANVKAPFSGNGFTQSDPFSGSFVYDNNLIPGPASGFVNVPFSSFPDIVDIPSAIAFSFNLNSLHFTLADNLNNLTPAAIQYNNGQFNGFVFVTNFSFLSNDYQFRIDGSVITVRLLAGEFPTGNSLINAHINTGNSNLTDPAPYTPGVAVGETPIPGALPLFGSVLGAGIFLAHRRRQKAAGTAV